MSWPGEAAGSTAEGGGTNPSPGGSDHPMLASTVAAPNLIRRNVWRASVRAEPFRLLFPLGVGFGLTGAGHWLLFGLGLTGHYSGVVHASLQIQGFLASFTLGFLLTALPKFNVGPPVSPAEAAGILGGAGLVAVGCLGERWTAIEVGSLVQLLTVGLFAWRRYWGRATTQPPVLVMLTVGWLHAVAGAAALLWIRLGGPPGLELFGRRLLWQGAMVAVVIGMGGHLIPRLLGYPEGVVPKHPARRGWRGVAATFRGEALAWWGTGLLLFAGFVIEAVGHERTGRLLRAVVVTIALLAAGRFWRLPQVLAPFAWGVWGSVWAVIGGSWAAALTHPYHVAALHLVFIGGFSLMVLMVGARVTLSHGGYMALEARNRPIRWVGGGVVAALVLRLAVDATPEHYFQVAAAAASVWMAAGLLWLVYHLPKMVYREFAVVAPMRSFRVVPPKG